MYPNVIKVLLDMKTRQLHYAYHYLYASPSFLVFLVMSIHVICNISYQSVKYYQIIKYYLLELIFLFMIDWLID